MILNKITLDYYIGSAYTNQMYNSFYKHLIYLKGGSQIVKLAVKKYKLSLPNFAFLVLKIFLPVEKIDIVNPVNNKQLLDLEEKIFI